MFFSFFSYTGHNTQFFLDTDALEASSSGAPARMLECTMKRDEIKDALLTLVLVLVLQGDFQQSKDYIQKLTESCAQSSAAGQGFGAGEGVPLQGTSEFLSLLIDFVVC